MENKVFEANLALIYEYNPKLANKVRNLKNYSQTFELSKTQKDEYNLKVNEIDIHSNLGAIDEAREIAGGISNLKEKNSVVVIFGLGLGYLFDEVVQNAAGNVILFEPNLEILKCTLEIVDMTELLTKKSVKICSEIEDLKRYIEEFSDKLTKISISFLTTYFRVYENQIKEVAQIIEYSHGESAALNNTIERLGARAAINTFINLENLLDAHFIKEFSGKFKNRPALVVGAGPSLAKNIEIIKQNRNKFIIFCVGPALKLLLKNGIKPDFAVIIEPKNVIGQIENLDLTDINLIVEPYAHPNIWNFETKSKTVFFSNHNFLNDYFASALKINNENLHSFGTVSYCAMSSAQLMGCNPIVLIGQDLAYADGKCYAKGSVYENLECKFNEKTNKFEIVVSESARKNYAEALLGHECSQLENSEARLERYLNSLNDNLYTVDGQNGEKLPTQASYAIFIKHFEEFAAQNSGLFGAKNRLINSSTGGAQINGFENLPLGDIVSDAVGDVIGPLQNFNKDFSLEGKTNYNKENLVKTIAACVSDFKKVIAISGEMKELLEKINKEFKTRKTVTKTAEKLLDRLSERMQYFEKNYFEKDPVIYYCHYAYYKPFADLLNKNKYSEVHEEISEKFEIFPKVPPYCLKFIEDALTKCNEKP